MADIIQHRRDTAANWALYNPILAEGEMGIVTDDPNQYKIGDGVHTWNELPLRGFDGTVVHELGTSEIAVMSQKGSSDWLNAINRIGSKANLKVFGLTQITENIGFLQGGYVDIYLGNLIQVTKGVDYGITYIPIVAGKAYVVKGRSLEYDVYGAICFSKSEPVDGAKADSVVYRVDETKVYDIEEVFVCASDGYLLIGDWGRNFTIYEIDFSSVNYLTKQEIDEVAEDCVNTSVLRTLRWIDPEQEISDSIFKELSKIQDLFVTWDEDAPDGFYEETHRLIVLASPPRIDGDTLNMIGIRFAESDASFIIFPWKYFEENAGRYAETKVPFTYKRKTGVLHVVAKWNELAYNTEAGAERNVIINDIGPKILLRSNLQDISKEVEDISKEAVTLSDLQEKQTLSEDFCDYLRFISSGDNYQFVNDTASIEETGVVFNGNVSRVSDISTTETAVAIYGRFESTYDWLQKLKNYQSEDGTPLKMNIKARVFNHGTSRVAIDFGVRYKESEGSWILPNVSTAIPAKSYKDITLSFTPDYNDLTTIIDLYTIISGYSDDTVLEFGNMDLYWDDPKKRDSRAIIIPEAIKKGITFEQLDENLQKRISESSLKTPNPKLNIVCSGSSITWGDGRLDGSFVGALDKEIKEKMSRTIFSDELTYSTPATKLTNGLFYGSTAHKIEGVGAKVNFSLFGDEIAICQAKLRTDGDYGIMTVKANGEVIGTFDNKNYIGSDTESFSGESLRKVRLKRPCTFDHEITVNGSVKLTNIQFNSGGYGGTVPEGCEAFVYRGLDSEGNPVHYIDLSEDLGTITSVTVKYKYGKIIAHERSTVGQTQDSMTNESVYGVGSVAFDPAHPTGGISSGMEFRGIDINSFFIYKFNTAEVREFEIEITGGNNPYLILNFVTNRFNNLMNAGIGGWGVAPLVNNDKVNDYTQFYKWFQPDIIFQESSTNDDWSYPTRRISRSIGNLSKDALVKLWGLEVSKVTYNSESDNYAVEMATGLISEITTTSLKSNAIIGTSTQVGDIVRIGNYYGDNKAVVCRKISEVDTETGVIKWVQPITPEDMLNIEKIDDLVGKEINIRNLDGYKTKYKELIEKIREISPQAKIVIVASGLSMYGLRQLWGYDIVHRELCDEYPNVEYCDVTDWLYDAMKYGISGSRTETVESTGASSYDLSFKGNRNSWQGFKVLVDGIDVYGKTCHIESGFFYHADSNKNGTDLNKNGVYNNKGVDNQTIPMKLVFEKDAPASGKQIVVQFSDTTWSGDYCHTNEYGAFLYGQMYAKHI